MKKTIFTLILTFQTLLASWASAATYRVDNLEDEIDANVGNGLCESASETCTLRAAIMEANATPESDTILIAEGIYPLSIPGTGEDESLTGDLDINTDMELIGEYSEQGGVVIDADLIDERAFEIRYPTETVLMETFAVINGVDDYGGAIYNQSASLILSGLSVHDNEAEVSGGAVFHVGASLTLSSTQIYDNEAYYGGGVFSQGSGPVTIDGSRITSNDARANGGGILVTMPQAATVDVTIQNSAISGNNIYPLAESIVFPTLSVRSIGFGGAGMLYYGQGTLQISDSSFSGNGISTTQCIDNIYGGGLYFMGHEGAGDLSVMSSDFSYNAIEGVDGDECASVYHAGAGAAFREGDALSVSSSEISSNSVNLSGEDCTARGVGLYAYDNGNVSISGSDVLSNTSVSSCDESSTRGTGADLWDNKDISITESNFDSNSVDYTGTLGVAMGIGLTIMPETDDSSSISIKQASFSSNFLTADSGDTSSVGEGIGFYIQGNVTDLTMEDSVLNENRADIRTSLSRVYGIGAFIYSSPVSIVRTTLSSNVAVAANVVGGGLYLYIADESNGATLSIEDSTIDGNEALASSWSGGAGLSAFSHETDEEGGTLFLTNTTISGNISTGESDSKGGGIYVNQKMTASLANVTITANQVESNGGGIYAVETANAVNLKNTIVAGNVSSRFQPDCGDDLGITSFGYNLVGDVDGCDFSETTGDQTGDSTDTGILDPDLGTLRSNGGSTLTHLPSRTSPAIDAGNPDGCTDFYGVALSEDQRGASRPYDGDRDREAVCDIGSVERTRAKSPFSLPTSPGPFPH